MSQILLTDESLNRYGFRVLTNGLQMEGFKKNPVLFWNHFTGLPLGKWKDMEVKDGKLYAVPELDEGDQQAAEIDRKVKAGYINAASIGFRILEVSEEPMLMMEGQTRPTVTKAELMEVSLVGIPANANAVRLYDQDGAVIELTGDSDTDFSKLDAVLPTIKPKEIVMKQVFKTLGLATDANEQQVVDAIKAKDLEIAELQADIAQIKKEAKKESATALVDAALGAKKITAAQKEQWTKLALADYDAAKATLDGMEAYESPSKLIEALKQNGGNDAGNEKLTDAQRYDQLATDGKLVELKNTNPTEFEKLQKAKIESVK